MKIKILLLIMPLFLMTGCFENKEKDNIVLRDEVKEKVASDIGYLSNLETFFGVDFTNKSANRILADDFYVRVDDASVFYGYSLDKIKIEVDDINGVKTLSVVLPTPEKISINRNISDLKTRRQNYTPIDINGEKMDVEKEIMKAFNQTLDKYEPKLLDLTKSVSKEYFEMIAQNFGLKLNLKYE